MQGIQLGILRCEWLCPSNVREFQTPPLNPCLTLQRIIDKYRILLGVGSSYGHLEIIKINDVFITSLFLIINGVPKTLFYN
jgi:hypothetical protein